MHRAFFFCESGELMDTRDRCGIFPIQHGINWPVWTIVPFAAIARAKQGNLGAQQRIVDEYKYYSEDTESVIYYDDLTIGESPKAATEDEINSRHIDYQSLLQDR